VEGETQQHTNPSANSESRANADSLHRPDQNSITVNDPTNGITSNPPPSLLRQRVAALHEKLKNDDDANIRELGQVLAERGDPRLSRRDQSIPSSLDAEVQQAEAQSLAAANLQENQLPFIALASLDYGTLLFQWGHVKRARKVILEVRFYCFLHLSSSSQPFHSGLRGLPIERLRSLRAGKVPLGVWRASRFDIPL